MAAKKVEYLNFGQALEVLENGKKVRERNWGKKDYLKIIRTKEKGDDIINQRFIAHFFYNGGYMPHPYVPTQFDMLVGHFIVVD